MTTMVEEIMKDAAIAAACHIVNILDTSPDVSKSQLVGDMTYVVYLAILAAFEQRGQFLEQIGYLLPSEN